MEAKREEILKALEQVIDPELHKPVTELDMVRDVVVDEGGQVAVTIALTVAGCPMRSSFEDQVQRFVGAVEGVTSVELRFDVMSAEEKAALSSRLRGGRPDDHTGDAGAGEPDPGGGAGDHRGFQGRAAWKPWVGCVLARTACLTSIRP